MEEDATLGRIGGFRLIKRLATGGTSDVLLARAEGPHGFERTVVLKRLLSEHQNDPDFAKMFAREAAAYARLSHPAIVRLFDFFTANAQLIMVLEYVDGVSLARLMTHAAQTGQKLDDRVCFFLASRVFDALSAAHDAHNPDNGDPTPVIHRDVNPSNVLIPWDGHAKLADFGIAKIQGPDEAETSQGLIKGTYGYMAPEQVRGERVTIRTDVYAASLVLWELLTRRKAIQADKLPEMEVLRAMAEPNLPKLDVLRPEVHESVREALGRGLEPNPARRAITAEEMLGVLRANFDPDDARQRLVRVLNPLSPRRSLSDTIAEDMRETAEGPLPSFAGSSGSLPASRAASPAMTLPLPTERKPPPRPAPPPPPPAASPAAMLGATAVMTSPAPPPPAPVRTQTPSGFRPVAAPQAMPSAALNKPTLAGGFAPAPPMVPVPAASDAPTQKNQAVSNAAAVLPQSSGSLPAAALVTPWPPPPQPVAPAPQIPFAPFAPPGPYTPPPILPGPAPRRGSYVVAIVVAVIAAGVIIAAAAFALMYFRRAPEEATTPAVTATATAPPPTTTTTATATTSQTTAATATATATATPTATASATATPTATATATATASTPANLPTPSPTEGVLLLPAYAHDHRIYVDGRVKGDGDSPIVIPCGERKVQIGSAGKPRTINVPCGAVARIQ